MPELRNEISFTGADLCAGSIEVPCSGCQTQITITPLANLFEKFEEGSEEVKCPACKADFLIPQRVLVALKIIHRDAPTVRFWLRVPITINTGPS